MRKKKSVAALVPVNEQEALEALQEISNLVVSENIDLRYAARKINDLLALIENLLVRVYLEGYNKWLRERSEAAAQGLDEPPLPPEILTLGEKTHKMLIARGKFVLELLEKLQEKTQEGKVMDLYILEGDEEDEDAEEKFASAIIS